MEQEQVYIEVIKTREATLSHADKYKENLFTAIENGNKYLLVDFTDVDIVDSTFLGVLVVSLKRAVAKGGDLRVFALKEEINLMFELTRLSNVFKIFATKEEALKSFSSNIDSTNPDIEKKK